MQPKFLLASLLLALGACSSGGSDDDNNVTPVNQAPIVTVNDASAIEKETITIASDASDADGTISSYTWTQTAGTQAVMTSNDANLTLTLPEISESAELVFELTVQDNDGATATDSFTVSVEPILRELTVTGSVTTSEEKLVNQDMMLTIGNQSWESQTNELGTYRLEIAVDDSNFDAPFVLQTGIGNNTILTFASITPSINELDPMIGEDNIIDATTHEAFTIDAVSTARFILASVYDQEPMTSYQSFVERSNDWLPQTGFDLITFIELLANAILDDDYDNKIITTLPTNFLSITDYLNSGDTIESFLREIKKTAHYPWQETTPKLLSSFDSSVKSLDLSVPIILDGEFRMILDADGTGVIYGTEQSDVTWALENDVLTLNILSEEFPAWFNNSYYIGRDVNRIEITSHYTSDKGHLVSYVQRYTDYDSTTVEHSAVAPLLPVDNTVALTTLLAKTNKWYMNFGDLISYDVEVELEGISDTGRLSSYTKEMVFETTPVSENTYNVEISKFILNEDQEPELETFNTTATIQDGKINISYGPSQISIAVLDWNNNDEYTLYVVAQDTENTNFFNWSLGSAVAKSEPVPLDEQTIAGKKLVFETEDHNLHWYEFNADGTMAYIFANDDNYDGVIEDNNYSGENFRISAGLWRVVDNQLQLLRHYGNYRDYGVRYTCLNGVWAPSLEDKCRAYIYREWRFLFDINDINSHGGYINVRSEIYYDRHVDNSQGLINETKIPYYFFYSTFKMLVSDTRPVELPANAYQIAEDD